MKSMQKIFHGVENSKATGDAIASDSPQEDPLIMVSYSVPLK